MNSSSSTETETLTGEDQIFPARLHHIGFVVNSIAASAQGFIDSLHATWDGNIFHDPLQRVRVTFLQSRVPGEACMELVEPADEQSPVTGFLRSGGGLHHLCYEVDDLELQLKAARSHGALVVKPPLPAAAFGGRRIAWVFTRQRLLLEYLEASKKELA
ncbi:MAG TPA: VOC family protein [Terriglobales bacterium]|nr:VOC family protein [Terriglobales bacterium]